MATTWVLVADSSRARIFSTTSQIAPLYEIETLAHPEGRLHEQALTTDLPGSDRDAAGAGRHAMGTEVSPKQQESINFARCIANHLNGAYSNQKYEHLIIVAAPGLLGILRKQLAANIAKHIVLELDKNLAQLKASEIRKHLPERLPV